MLSAILTNINRMNSDLKLFELSRVYQKKEERGVDETTHLCIGVAGKKSDSWLEKAHDYNFFDLKGISFN